MDVLTPADRAAFEALKETCRAQSLRLDAARERIEELEAALVTKERTIAEQRALLTRAGSLSERFNDPMQGDKEST
ncbi:MAG: hypothetical protein KGL35_00940 [Bradyrhizobium sp.]|nr:hypothetical protein [Bradyrhizobium sp.]